MAELTNSREFDKIFLYFLEENESVCTTKRPALTERNGHIMDCNKRPDTMARITTKELADVFIAEQVQLVREQVGDKKVLLALSGGVDSSVVATLLIKAIGKQLVCVHVNHGLMRKGESEQVIEVFGKELDANLIYIDATDRFLDLLKDVAEPEKKR